MRLDLTKKVRLPKASPAAADAIPLPGSIVLSWSGVGTGRLDLDGRRIWWSPEASALLDVQDDLMLTCYREALHCVRWSDGAEVWCRNDRLGTEGWWIAYGTFVPGTRQVLLGNGSRALLAERDTGRTIREVEPRKMYFPAYSCDPGELVVRWHEGQWRGESRLWVGRIRTDPWEVLWRAELPMHADSGHADLCAWGGSYVASTCGGKEGWVCLDTGGGRTLWHDQNEWSDFGPVAHEGRVYKLGCERGRPPSFHFCALDIRTGEYLVRRPLPQGLMDGSSRMVAVGDVGWYHFGREIAAFDLATGECVGRQKVPTSSGKIPFLYVEDRLVTVSDKGDVLFYAIRSD